MVAAYRPLGKLTQGARPPNKRPLKVGRQTKLTPEISKKICDFIRAGNFFTIAARATGVGEATANEWLARGRGEHASRSVSSIYREFAQDVDAAEAMGEATAVLHWRSAMPKDWHASEKWLSVRASDRWAPRTPDQLNAGAFAGVQVNIGTGAKSTAESGPREVPLQHLLDENPDLISGTMAFLDQMLPLDNQPQYEPPAVNEMKVIEAETGSWREVTDVEDAREGPDG